MHTFDKQQWCHNVYEGTSKGSCFFVCKKCLKSMSSFSIRCIFHDFWKISGMLFHFYFYSAMDHEGHLLLKIFWMVLFLMSSWTSLQENITIYSASAELIFHLFPVSATICRNGAVRIISIHIQTRSLHALSSYRLMIKLLSKYRIKNSAIWWRKKGSCRLPLSPPVFDLSKVK